MSDAEKTTAETNAGIETATEHIAAQPTADEHTTAPNPLEQNPLQQKTAAPGWEMPKPVFQKTSGYLPQGFVKEVIPVAAPESGPSPSTDALPSRSPAATPDLSVINLSAPAASPVPPESLASAAPSAPVISSAPAALSVPVASPAVEPQPDLSEVLVPDENEFQTSPAPAAKSGAFGMSMLVLGLTGIMIFVAVFLTVIYFLFLAEPGQINNF